MNIPEICAAFRFKLFGWTVMWVPASLLWCSPARPKTWRNCWWTIPIPLCWLYKAWAGLLSSFENIFAIMNWYLDHKLLIKAHRISSQPKTVICIIWTWRWFQIHSCWWTINHTKISVTSYIRFRLSNLNRSLWNRL